MSGPNDRIREEGPMGSGFSEHPNDDGGYHRTLYDKNSNDHISWDTDRDGNYRDHGHEDRDGRPVNQWDR